MNKREYAMFIIPLILFCIASIIIALVIAEYISVFATGTTLFPEGIIYWLSKIQWGAVMYMILFCIYRFLMSTIWD